MWAKRHDVDLQVKLTWGVWNRQRINRLLIWLQANNVLWIYFICITLSLFINDHMMWFSRHIWKSKSITWYLFELWKIKFVWGYKMLEIILWWLNTTGSVVIFNSRWERLWHWIMSLLSVKFLISQHTLKLLPQSTKWNFPSAHQPNTVKL